jgi:hypothetical protein
MSCGASRPPPTCAWARPQRFAPSLTRLGEIAASQPADSMFIAMSWGLATQIVSLTNNQMEVLEAFWVNGPDGRLPRLLELHPNKRVFYLVSLDSIGDVPNRRKDIEYDFASSDAVVEEPVPEAFRHLAGIGVRRYVRR